MAGNEYDEAVAGQPPGPDPALRKLDRFVGTWDVRGRTLGADQDDVSGRLIFGWLPGGFFLQQRSELDFQGLDVRGLEVIGYDPASGSPRRCTRTWWASRSRTSTTSRATA